MSVGISDRVLRVAVVATAVFMANLDLWIVTVALPDLGHSLGGSLSSLSWVLNAYAVVLAAALVPAGRLGDRIGSRSVFLVGTTLFTLASLACAAAPSLPLLVAARVVQAVGAAATLPTSLALLLASVPESSRTAAARGWAAVGALAAVCGPVLGGLLVTASWRWVFVVNLPVGVAAVVVGRAVLPHVVRPGASREPVPDVLGSLLLVVAVSALTGALVQAPTWGWTSGRTVVLLAVTLVSALALVRRSARHPRPLLELPLLRVRRFAVANAALFVFAAAFAVMLLSNSLWCQQVWGWSALQTGLALAPGPAMVPLATFGSARLMGRIGQGPLTAIGCVLFAVGLLWRVVAAGTSPDYVRDLLPSMLIGGIGVGLALSTLIATGATALPAVRAATGSAIVNTTRQVASALGVAVLVSVLSAQAGVGGYRTAWTITTVASLVAGGLALLLPRPAAVPTAVALPVAEAA